MTLRLFAYSPSVYCQIVRLILAEVRADAELVERDPFTDTVEEHPYNRVPVLEHDGNRIYETVAILRYLDSHFAVGRLTPTDPLTQARMVQVQALADTYGYWPLARQVFVQGAERPSRKQACDPEELTKGLNGAKKLLPELEKISAEGLVLNARAMTLADCHLAPMIGFFARAPEGAALLKEFTALSAWFAWVSQQESYRSTDPNRFMT
tara:strand:+ start:2088 stop:2714 length:627 start_codon:yes stop_codon:yes gene_type:complete